MSKIYVGYFADAKDLVLLDYVGYAKSEYLVVQFLKQFNVDKSVYSCHIVSCDEEGDHQELEALSIFIYYDIKIDIYDTWAGNTVLLTPKIYMTWLESFRYKDGLLLGKFYDADEESDMYNRLFGIVEHGIFRDAAISTAIRKLILLVFKKYRSHMLDPYDEVNNFDHIEFMIREQYMNPIQRKGES